MRQLDDDNTSTNAVIIIDLQQDAESSELLESFLPLLVLVLLLDSTPPLLQDQDSPNSTYTTSREKSRIHPERKQLYIVDAARR